ncbi:MAG: hypothetical protein ACR2H2_04430 [Solirubrobacteraceae bacterium]
MASVARALTYALRWLAAGAAVTAAALALLQGGNEPRPPAPAALPPVREIGLLDAVRDSDCRLRRLHRGSALAKAGPRTDPAGPGSYRTSLPASVLGAALRRGIIVIQYHPRVSDRFVGQLVVLQRAVPRGTIVAPLGSPRADALVVAAYGRVLRCPRANDQALTALRLFRGRFVGTGPQRGG